MWLRSDLKSRAKEVLRTNYWKAFLISIVIAIAGGSNGGSSSGGGGSNRYANPNSRPFFFDTNFYEMMAIIWTIILIITAGIFLFRILVGYPLEVGGRRYFIRSAQYSDNSNCFRYGFSGQNYGRIVGTMFLKGVLNFLWFLLFIIPGIIKAYAYSMVPYILADDPEISFMEAIKISNRMTDGHKFDMFVLDLSFIGWYLLGALALGIGVLFVMPYENATKAELYLVLKDNQRMANFSTSQWNEQ